jgi:prevent-host-death family protein
MRSVGVRELKNRASDVRRSVRDRGEEIEVTYRGRPVAKLVPVRSRGVSARRMSGLWSDLDRLADEIGRRWPSSLTAAEAVKRGRHR